MGTLNGKNSICGGLVSYKIPMCHRLSAGPLNKMTGMNMTEINEFDWNEFFDVVHKPENVFSFFRSTVRRTK